MESGIFEECFRILMRLPCLQIEFCDSFKTLPESFGNLSSLTDLRIFDSKITTIPESFGNLSSLGRLQIYGGENFIYFPNSIKNLRRIRLLYLTDSFSPVEIERLKKLLPNCGIKAGPPDECGTK